MLIDAHDHPHYHGYSDKGLIQNMDQQGIDKMWLCVSLTEGAI